MDNIISRDAIYAQAVDAFAEGKRVTECNPYPPGSVAAAEFTTAFALLAYSRASEELEGSEC